MKGNDQAHLCGSLCLPTSHTHTHSVFPPCSPPPLLMPVATTICWYNYCGGAFRQCRAEQSSWMMYGAHCNCYSSACWNGRQRRVYLSLSHWLQGLLAPRLSSRGKTGPLFLRKPPHPGPGRHLWHSPPANLAPGSLWPPPDSHAPSTWGPSRVSTAVYRLTLFVCGRLYASIMLITSVCQLESGVFLYPPVSGRTPTI